MIELFNNSRKFKQDKFVPMSYGTIGLLSSTLYEEVKNKDFPLEFNPDVCWKLIEPKAKVEKELEAPITYWYSDFEADTSGRIHQEYLNNLQSSDGSINKSFKGKNCGYGLLNYLPTNSIVCFHNLTK